MQQAAVAIFNLRSTGFDQVIRVPHGKTIRMKDFAVSM